MSEKPIETLHVVLEDVGGTSWWASLLTTLTSQYGSTQLRFVGQVNGEKRYRSDIFSSPRPVRPVPPEEQWAPGLTAALRDLVRKIESDGWSKVSCGTKPWELTFQRELHRGNAEARGR